MAIMEATMKMPPPPAPVKTRPTMKCSKVVDVEVTAAPIQMSMVEKNMQSLGLNT